MKKTLSLATALTLSLGMAAANANTVIATDFFGTTGDATDVPTDINETLSANWAILVPGGATITNIMVEVFATLTTQGSVTNTGSTPADLTVNVGETPATFGGAPFQAVTGDLGGADKVFFNAGDLIISQSLGTVGAGDSINFDPITWDSGWMTTANGLTTAPGTINYTFTNKVVSFVSGSGNTDSSIITGSSGGLRVTVDYDPAPPVVPAPAPIAMLGLGLLGLVARRRIGRAA